jgi:hypothetical protein
MDVQARNNWASVSETGIVMATHGFPSVFHTNHYHRSLKALLKRPRSRMPKPPNLSGLRILLQLPAQCPHVVVSLPCHRKARQILSIFFMAHLLLYGTFAKLENSHVTDHN